MKFIGAGVAGAAVFGVWKFTNFGLTDSNKKNTVTQTSIPSVGPWTFGPDSPIIAIHGIYFLAANFCLSKGGNHLAFKKGSLKAVLFDPDEGAEQTFEFTEDELVVDKTASQMAMFC